jgi:16S rRNA (cytosine967-C5)-methyltransferase
LATALLAWLPAAGAEAFARAAATPPPLDLRINPARTDRATQQAAFAAAGVTAEPLPDHPLALTLPGRSGDLRALPGYREGHWCVQDRHAHQVQRHGLGLTELPHLTGARVLCRVAAGYQVLKSR